MPPAAGICTSPVDGMSGSRSIQNTHTEGMSSFMSTIAAKYANLSLLEVTCGPKNLDHKVAKYLDIPVTLPTIFFSSLMAQDNDNG